MCWDDFSADPNYPKNGFIEVILKKDSLRQVGLLHFMPINGVLKPVVYESFFYSILELRNLQDDYKTAKWFKLFQEQSCTDQLLGRFFSLYPMEKIISNTALKKEFKKWCNKADFFRKVKRGTTFSLFKELAVCGFRLNCFIGKNLFVFLRHKMYPTFNIISVDEVPMLCIPEKANETGQAECEAFVGVYDLDVCQICGISQTTLHDLIRMHDPDYSQVIRLSDGNHSELADAFYKQLIYRMDNGYKSVSILMNGVCPLPPLNDQFLDVRLVAKIYETATGKSSRKRLSSLTWLDYSNFSLVDVTYNAQT